MVDIPSPSIAVPTSSNSSQRNRPIQESNSESITRIPPHATTPTSQTQSQSSRKTLALNSGPMTSDRKGVDGNKYEESRTTSSNLQSHSSIQPVAAKESAAIVEAGSGNGKRNVIRKTVRIVKKVIKRRVPKRVLRNCSENQGVAEDGINLSSKVRDNLDLADNVIEKSIVVDDVVERTSVVNEANNELSVANDVTESSNLVNKKENITHEVMQELEIGNATNVSEPSGIAYMELDRSKLNSIAKSSEKVIPVNDLSGISTMETDNIERNDVVSEVDGNDLTIRAPDLLDVKKVNDVSGTSLSTKEIENSKADNQSEDFIVETKKIDIVHEVDVELRSGQHVGPVGEKSETTIRKDESGSEMASDRIKLTEGLLLNGEMEAPVRTKRHKMEIFVGGLDRDAQEDDIRKVFGEAGVIVEIRVVMSNSGKNRGYAFVRFATAADAKNALENYSKVKICGKQCNIAPVEGNDTIFLGNIDRNWKTEDVVTLLKKGGIDKIDRVTLKADPDHIEKNRGFAFVEFETCKDAQTAFKKLQKKDFFGKQMVKAAWARSSSEPAEEEILQHEPRNQGKAVRSGDNYVKVDKRSSTTDELVQILRQQASNKHILSHPRRGIDIPDHHFPLSGSKRTFSLSGHDLTYAEHQGFSRQRIASSHPISGPSSPSHGVRILSFPYHHQVPGFISESVNERRTYPSHFQKREEAPYYADNNMHRRYW